MSMHTKNLWRALGVKPGSTTSELRSAYRNTMRRVHTDRGGSQEEATFVNLAWEVLEDEDRRKEYTQARQAWADELGAVLCTGCGEANRVTRRPSRLDRLVCGHCKNPIEISDFTVSVLQGKAIRIATDEFINEFGTLIIDRVRREVRRRLG